MTLINQVVQEENMRGSRQWQLIDKESHFEHVAAEKLVENPHSICNSYK